MQKLLLSNCSFCCQIVWLSTSLLKNQLLMSWWVYTQLLPLNVRQRPYFKAVQYIQQWYFFYYFCFLMERLVFIWKYAMPLFIWNTLLLTMRCYSVIILIREYSINNPYELLHFSQNSAVMFVSLLCMLTFFIIISGVNSTDVFTMDNFWKVFL